MKSTNWSQNTDNRQLPHAKKSLGQHWLTDESSLQAMCDAADIQANDTVLEIGPGPGTLTKKLVDRAHQLIAVEFGKQLAHDLPGRVAAPNLQVVNQDILQFDLTALPAGYRVVANIPYYLTSNLLRVLSESTNPPVRIVLLVQKEVAERVAAKPGDMSLLSVTTQWFYEPSLGGVVPADLFTPPPKVDSQIITLTRRLEPWGRADTRALFRIVKAGFSQRRKTLLNSLSSGLRLDKETAEQTIRAANVAPTTRPQALNLQEWFRLYEHFQKNS